MWGGLPLCGFVQPCAQAGRRKSAPLLSSTLASEYDVPEDTFVLLELTPGYLNESVGTIQYHEAFRNI